MKKPEIIYPCWWTYAIIGPDEEQLRLAVGKVTRNTRHRVAFSKESPKKRYVSLHVEVWVATQDERDSFFQAFIDHPDIRMVI
jgi:putative lipoic acid-binding regulatory protein